MNKKVEINFEKALEELESIVEDLESGDLSLENSLKSFEKGIKLTLNWYLQNKSYYKLLSKKDISNRLGKI